MRARVRLRKFVATLLHDLSPEAALVGLSANQDGTGCLVRIAIPGVMIGKSLQLRRGLIDDARTNPKARASLRAILRAALRIVRGHRTISDSLRLPGQPASLSSCRVCARPVPLDEQVVFEAAGLRHVRCLRPGP